MTSSDTADNLGQAWPFSRSQPSPIKVEDLLQGNYGSIYEIQDLQRVFLAGMERPGERTEWFEHALGPLSNSIDCSIKEDSESILCLHRFKVWWMRPVFVKGSNCGIPAETIMILYRDTRSSRFRLILPNAGSALQQGNGDMKSITLTCDVPTAQLYCGTGPNPYALMEDGVKMLAGQNCTVTEATSDFTHLGLGWCTWNAFYTQITGEKFVNAVRTLKERNIPVKWAILDDGWQHTTNDDAANGEQWSQRLASLTESPSKFGTLSLKDAIAQVRELGLTNVWAWHTLAGYWLGINPSEGTTTFPKTSLCFPTFPSGIIDSDTSICREASISNGIGIADDVNRFVDQYHSFLEQCGITGVKVDAQAVVAICQREGLANDGNRASLSSALHGALSRSMLQRFTSTSPQIIHCMAHDPSIFYQLPVLYPNQVPLMRASDDHYPGNPNSHGPHIVACAFNSLLLGHLSVPDWDMFTTSMEDEQFVALHTVARCISGGPVYVSDSPENVQKDVIDKVACADGTVLTCRDVAKPTLSCILRDPLATNGSCQTLFNYNGRRGKATSLVVAVFNLCGSGEWDYELLNYTPVESKVRSMRTTLVLGNQLLGLAHEFPPNLRFLAISALAKRRPEEVRADMVYQTAELHSCACDFISFIPILSTRDVDIVPLGFRGMINGAGCILEASTNDSNSIGMTVRGCGRFVVAIRSLTADIAVQLRIDQRLQLASIALHAPSSSDDQHLADLGYRLFEFEVPSCNDTSGVSLSAITQDIRVFITNEN
jgi:raffinose synthase